MGTTDHVRQVYYVKMVLEYKLPIFTITISLLLAYVKMFPIFPRLVHFTKSMLLPCHTAPLFHMRRSPA